MVYKNFRLICALRILLILVTIFVFFYLYYNTSYYVSLVVLFLLLLYQFFNLLHYVEKTNRYLRNFLESIRYADFSRSFQVKDAGSTFDELNKAFNHVINDFQKIRAEKEEHFYYLQNVIQHIGISLIVYRKNGQVEMINNAAKKMFSVNNLSNIILLEKFSNKLAKTIMNLKSGEKALVKTQKDGELLQLAVYAKEFKIKSKILKLVSIQNIQTELEEKEIEAWQKLIRVLTHEIMNSITPIASLSSTLNLMMKEVRKKVDKNCLPEETCDTLDDVKDALITIHKRSTGLLHFVESYRDLTRIPKPEFDRVDLSELLHNTEILWEKELEQNNIDFQISLDPHQIFITADEKLIEQVIINLVKNAIAAVKESSHPKVILNSYINKESRVILQITDNGSGIPKNNLEKIFVPFFTTKKQGSGIGLSLSRQIMRLHGGNISAVSEPDKETTFTLKF